MDNNKFVTIFREEPFPVFFTHDRYYLDQSIYSKGVWHEIVNTSIILNSYLLFRTENSITMIKFWQDFADDFIIDLCSVCKDHIKRFFIYYSFRLLVHVGLMQITTGNKFQMRISELKEEIKDLKRLRLKLGNMKMLPSNKKHIKDSCTNKINSMETELNLLMIISEELNLSHFEGFRKKIFLGICSIMNSMGISKAKTRDFIQCYYSKLTQLKGIPEIDSDSLYQMITKNKLPSYNSYLDEITKLIGISEEKIPSGIDNALDAIKARL